VYLLIFIAEQNLVGINAVVSAVTLSPHKLEFHGTDTDTETDTHIRDAPIV